MSPALLRHARIRPLAAATLTLIALPAGLLAAGSGSPALAAAGRSRAAVFSYVGEAYRHSARGASAVLPVARPHLDQRADHSLVELAVESADGRSIVEVGWVRSQGIAGGPRLFVSYWAGGSFHVDSGFHSTSRTPKPFQELPAGSRLRLGVSYGHGAWNVAVNGRRIGYFPGGHWGGHFRRAGIAQVFGEVESYGYSRTAMVDGTTRRAVTGFRLTGAHTPAGSFYSSARHGYYLGAHGATWFRLGGPGRG